MNEEDVPKFRSLLEKINKCSSEYNAFVASSKDQLISSKDQQSSSKDQQTSSKDQQTSDDVEKQKRLECLLQISELLNRHFQLCFEALSYVTVRKSLSETFRMKFHDEKNGESIGSRGMSEIMQMIDDYAEGLPLYVEAPKEQKPTRQASKRPISTRCPPLVGGIPLPKREKIPVGSMVTAWKNEEDPQDSKWILAEVLDRGEGMRGRNSYTLLDHVAESEYYRDFYMRSRTPPIKPTDNYLLIRGELPFLLKNVARSDIIPLPRFRANPRHNFDALFGPGSLVMARFPKTSVFYRAWVITPPVANLRDGYRVTFDMKPKFDSDGNYIKDHSVMTYVIPQLYVVQCPSGGRYSRMQHD